MTIATTTFARKLGGRSRLFFLSEDSVSCGEAIQLQLGDFSLNHKSFVSFFSGLR
jgi:hypothetical protein